MVKIRNIYGDEYRGKQRNAVYQRKYGRQIRRIKEDKKANRAAAQQEQQRRFKVGLAWYKSLSYIEKEGRRAFLNEGAMTLTPAQYAINTALSRGKVSKEVFEEQVITTGYIEGWDLEGWFYRQEITLTNNTASDLTDYQVKLELDASKVGAHFDWARMGADLRFYDEAGNKLSYYIESWDEASKQATIWVKVGLIPGSGSTTIKMYYGNPSAVSESDPEAVFDLYDDFDTYSWNDRVTANEGGLSKVYDISVSNSELVVKVYHGATGDDEGAVVYHPTAVFNPGHIIELKFKVSPYVQAKGLLNAYWVGFINEDTITGQGVPRDGAVAGYNSAYSAWGQTFSGYVGGAVSSISIPTSYTFDDYRICRVDWVDNKIRGYVDNEYIGTVTSNVPAGSLNVGFVIRSWSGSYNPTLYVDWVRVRKYAEQEPTAEFGAEEYGIEEGLATIQVEHVIIEHPGIQNVYIVDDTGAVIKEFTGLSNVANGEIATIIDWKNDTGKTVRTVIIESISGVLNKVVL